MGIASINFVVDEGEDGSSGFYHTMPVRKGNRARGKKVTQNRRYNIPEMYAAPIGDRGLRGCLKARV